MSVTAIVVMNHENKLTTTQNPLLRVKEVEEMLTKYAKDAVVFIDERQFDLRRALSDGARELFAVVGEQNKPIVGVENILPKSAELLIKHYYKAKTSDVVLFISASQLDRVKTHLDQVVLVTINNPSRELETISKGFTDDLKSRVNRKKLSMTEWSIDQSTEEHKRRYSVKIYS